MSDVSFWDLSARDLNEWRANPVTKLFVEALEDWRKAAVETAMMYLDDGHDAKARQQAAKADVVKEWIVNLSPAQPRQEPDGEATFKDPALP